MATNTISFASIILAAGMGTRMGQPKALLPVVGGFLVESLTRKLFQVSSEEIVVVTNSQVYKKLSSGFLFSSEFLARGKVLINTELEKGQLHSIKLGLAEKKSDTDAIMFFPVDFPFISLGTLKALAAQSGNGKIIIPSIFDKNSNSIRRGHPPVWGKDLIHLLDEVPFDQGARWVYSQYPELIEEMKTDDSAVIYNVNTPEEWNEGIEIYGQS